jgi:tight adherence protein B
MFGLNFVVTDLFLKERDEERERLKEQGRERDRQRIKEKLGGRNLDELAAEAMHETADDQTVLDKIREMLAQSGMKISMPQLLAFTVASAVVVGLPVAFLMGNLLAGMLAGGLGSTIPISVVRYQRQRRASQVLTQLPDALELMTRSIKAGQTINMAMLGVANEFRDPIGMEFSYCHEQQKLGLSADVALNDLAKRTGILEVRIFVLGLVIHQKSGGNLTELLSNLATIIRDRYRMRGKVKALTAEGRFQAVILMVLPVVAFLGLLLVSRDYALKLFDHPWLLVGCVISMGLGAVWIRRIVNFDF